MDLFGPYAPDRWRPPRTGPGTLSRRLTTISSRRADNVPQAQELELTQARPQDLYADFRIGRKRISTRLLSAAAMRRSMDTECP